jgi:hypothetical protein
MIGRQVILQLATAAGVGREFAGLRVSFRVEMTRESTPDTAKIRAWNLSSDSLALIQTPGAIVRLLVGYEVPQQIFQGNPISKGIRVVKQGPDRVLEIEAQSGHTALSSARVNASFATQTDLATVFSTVAASLGLPSGAIQLGDLGTRRLTQGVVLAGESRDILTRLCNSAGLEWFIRDDVLQVVTAGGSTGELVPIFSTVSGNLIGSPTKTENGVEARALISPTLRPGMMFQIQSESSAGLYICDSLVFEGDSGWETPFYVIPRGHAAP